MRAGGSSGASAVWGRGHNLRRLLVVAELALSVMLLIGAGLLIRSFAQLQRLSPGFDASSVLTLELTMSRPQVQRCRGRPPDLQAVVGAGVGAAWRDRGWWRHGSATEPDDGVGPDHDRGTRDAEGEKFINADIRVVGGDYFTAMNIPLRRGRVFAQDLDTRTVAARGRDRRADGRSQFWPGEDPIGKRIRTGGFDVTPDTPWMTIVGVVGDVKQDALDADSRIAYYRFHRADSVAGHEHRGAVGRRSRDARQHRSRSRFGRSTPTCPSTRCGRWGSASTHRWRSGGSRCCC